MNQHEVPLFHTLLQHVRKKTSSYHVPGHKNGMVGSNEFLMYFHSVLPFDLTELRDLDNLHHPTGVIAFSERLLADLYQTMKSKFLVNGSTAGNLAMILASVHPGDEVFVQRDSHQSVFHALEIAQAKPILMPSLIDEKTKMVVGIETKQLIEEMKKHSNSKVAIFTYPNYFGMGQSLEYLFLWMHKQGMTILVDEAHGAHFSLHSLFPKSALEMGADVVVQSAHKTLPAMTMGAFLHIQSSYKYQEKLSQMLQMIQTSSPSYPIMASLDYARYYAAHFTNQSVQQLLKKRDEFICQLNKIPQIQVVFSGKGFIQDPLKITIQSQTNLTGYELQQELENVNIYTELADIERVLFVLPLSEKFDGTKVVQALTTILQKRPICKKGTFSFLPKMTEVKDFKYSYQELREKTTKQISLEQSIGKIAAESIIPYPPGIPFIMKGEQIEREQVQNLQILQQHHAYFQGNDGRKIQIYDERKE